VHGFVDFLFQGSQQFAALFWVVLALLVASARLRGMPVVGRVGASGAQAWENGPRSSEGYRSGLEDRARLGRCMLVVEGNYSRMEDLEGDHPLA